MSNQIVKTAKELLLIEADLPHRFSYNGKQRPTVDDFQMYVFEQSWGALRWDSAALVVKPLHPLGHMYSFR